jgi:hypothetical protein
MSLGSYQPLTKMSITWNIAWGLRRAVYLTTFMCRLYRNLVVSTSCYPQGLYRGCFSFAFIRYLCWCSVVQHAYPQSKVSYKTLKNDLLVHRVSEWKEPFNKIGYFCTSNRKRKGLCNLIWKYRLATILTILNIHKPFQAQLLLQRIYNSQPFNSYRLLHVPPCLLTYLLTPWSRVLLQKLTSFRS